MINAYISGFKTIDYHTETAATAIDEPIAGQNGKRLALIAYDYLCGSTAHIMSVLHCGSVAGSRNTTSAAALSGQKDLIGTTAPTDPAGAAAAAGDIIAFQLTDGSWEWDTVASFTGSTITCTNNITGVDAGGGAIAVASGGRLLVFGVVGDGYNFKQGLALSVTTRFNDQLIIVAPFKGDPLFVTINNITAAGFLNNMLWAYINK